MKGQLIKILPLLLSVLGFILFQIISNSIGFEGFERSLSAGATMVVFYLLGRVIVKNFKS